MKTGDEVIGIFHKEKKSDLFFLSSALKIEVAALVSVKSFDIHGWKEL